MIHPLAPLAFRGVLWHQGEGGPAAGYRERLGAQVADWQKLFGHKFHFLWGSMTRNTSTPPPLGAEQQSHRGGIDEEFLLAAQDFGPNGDADLVGFFDLGNQSTHWGRKEEGGKRMAKAALATVYGKTDTIFTGPQLVEAKIDGTVVRAKFRHVGGGLIHEPSFEGISGFLLEEKGASEELRWAEVKIEGDTVILSHPDVKKPTNAYYGWHSNPHETLFNKEGYPAFPFRVVPRVFGAKSVAAAPLVELANPPEKAALNVSHVRRDGYIFNVIQSKGSGTVAVRAALSREWKSAVVTSKGKPVETGELKTEAGGRRYYEFTVELNGPDITVANAARPPDFAVVERF
jgi:sialate O-acetylesterase